MLLTHKRDRASAVPSQVENETYPVNQAACHVFAMELSHIAWVGAESSVRKTQLRDSVKRALAWGRTQLCVLFPVNACLPMNR
jgi:hypothetical protein